MEKALNIFIGVISLSNLYYLSPVIGLSNSSVVIFTLVISFIGFIYRFNLANYKLLGTKLTYRLVILSVMLLIINSISNYDFYYNDIIRILGYTFYFCWTYSIFNRQKFLLDDHLKKMIQILFVLILCLSVFEYFFYEIFRLIIDRDFIFTGNNRRLAVTFIDPNSFSFALISFAYIYLRIEKNLSLKVVVFFVTILLVNLSGSRLGLLLFLLMTFPLMAEFLRSFNVSKLLVVFIFGTALVFVPTLAKEDSKTDSIIVRLFDKDQSGKTSASSMERVISLENGLRAINLSDTFIPPGSFFFRSKWEKETLGKHYPHSTFLYMFLEYGVYVVWPLLILVPLYKKAKGQRNKVLYFMLVAGLLVLPNIIYYSTTFFIIYYLEHERSRNTAIT